MCRGKVAFFIWIFQTCKNLAFCATVEVQKVQYLLNGFSLKTNVLVRISMVFDMSLTSTVSVNIYIYWYYMHPKVERSVAGNLQKTKITNKH